MSFFQFAENQYVKEIDTGETIRMGRFKVTDNGELGHVRTTLYINGPSNLGGSETLTMKIYGDPGYSNLLYTSSASSISDIGTFSSDAWIGWFRLDFARENLNKNLDYYPTVEIANYTRSGTTFYLGLAHDFPFPVYDNSEDIFYDHPIAMQIFTYRE